jgi:hypothetical protein
MSQWSDPWIARDRLAEIADAFLEKLEELHVDISIEPWASLVGDLVEIEEHMSDV